MTRGPRALAWTMWRQHREWLRFLGICLALAALTDLLIVLAALTALLTRTHTDWINFAAPGIPGLLPRS